MPTRLLVASLGNPAPYTNTFHSAGHTLIESLRVFLNYPPFVQDSLLAPGLVSRGEDYTLYQSPSFMNTSGPAVARAYKSFLRTLPVNERPGAQLVVLHDELESAIGNVKKKVGGSARGHNGIKSCLGSFGGQQFTRIGVGIGRPESRDSAAVSNYVLRKMNSQESEKIRSAAPSVAVMLEEIQQAGLEAD